MLACKRDCRRGRVDQTLLTSEGVSVRLLKGGCVCCTARNEFRTALLDIVEAHEEVKSAARLVVETTGMANPAPLIETIAAHPLLDGRIQMIGVITLVDCMNAAANYKDYPEFTNQVICADRILLTKMDMVDKEVADAVVELVHDLNPYADVIRNDDRSVIEFLTDRTKDVGISRYTTRIGGRASSEQSFVESAHAGIRSFCISIEAACDWAAFAIWLSLLVHGRGDNVLRVKGLLNIAGNGAPVAINCVRNVVYFPEHLDEWPDAEFGSVLVFIVRDLDPSSVLQSLRAFLRDDRPQLHLRDSVQKPTLREIAMRS